MGEGSVAANVENLTPLAALGVPEEPETREDLPLAYLPRIPEGSNFRELLERAVGWGRR